MILTMEEFQRLVGPISSASDADIQNDFGCSPENLQQFIDLAVAAYPNSRYTAIENWTWLDIDVPEDQIDEVRDAGVHASIVFTDDIIIDNPDRRFSGVTSTLLKEFTHNCLFRTRNTTYILCGPGRRVKASSLAYNIAFGRVTFTLALGRSFKTFEES
jgi:hypothetical protein